MLEAGKLYICENYFLLLYPDPETAAAAAVAVVVEAAAAAAAVATATAFGRSGAAAAANSTDYWSNRFGKPVLYAKKNTPILVLNSKEKYVEVLAGDRKGWIIYQDWLELKEISNENIS